MTQFVGTQAPGGSSQRGSHRLSTVMECPRRWFFNYVLGIRPLSEPDYLTRGSLIHLHLAYHYGVRCVHRPAWLDTHPFEHELALTANGKPDQIQIARAVVDAYIAKSMDQNGVPYAVEHEIGASIADIRRVLKHAGPDAPEDVEIVTSRIDLMAVIGGLIYFKDYKSTLRGWNLSLPKWTPEGEFHVKLQFQLQQALGQVAFGAHFGGVMIQRLKCKPPYDMDEHLLPQPEAYMSELVDVLRACVRREREVREEAAGKPEGWLPIPHPWACFSYSRPCDYRALCLVPAGGNRETIRAFGYKNK